MGKVFMVVFLIYHEMKSIDYFRFGLQQKVKEDWNEENAP